MTTTQAEHQLRLNTLTRKLDEPTGGEVTRGVTVAVGLAVLVVLQVLLFAPIFAGR